MSRAVTCDHVLFDECIDAFRRKQENYVPFIEGKSRSYLLTAFKLDKSWDLGICVVHPSIQIHLPGAYSAFISTVENPDWVEVHNSHLFGIALAAIVSFLSGRPCKSTRDDYLCRYENLSGDDLLQLALLNPILTAGPGCTHISLSSARQDSIGSTAKTFIAALCHIDYKSYRIIMQATRMVHLSLINKREDFGLGYLLVVSAIESIAQIAVKRDKVKIKNPYEAQWKKKADEDSDFATLLNEYLDSRGKNEYLKERFVKFIRDYAPAEKWEDYVPHPLKDMADYIKDVSPLHSVDHIIKKHWFEKYPNELDSSEIEKILASAYTHRSCFIHRGEQPPHQDPSPSSDRFFQVYREYTEHNLQEQILPNYELLLGISQHAILNWLARSKA